MNFDDARNIGWRYRPWWWGGWGTYHVAPWGMADEQGWLLAVGAFEWLWLGETRYKPEPDTPHYFVTRDGDPLFADPCQATRDRIWQMTPAGVWYRHPWLDGLGTGADNNGQP